jgi:hypothetical protein
MSSLAQYADPLKAYIVEASLGTKSPSHDTAPCDRMSSHIASMLNKGLESGIGLHQWCLRKPIGVRFNQETLDEIAMKVKEGYCSGTDPCWRLEVRW